MNAYLFTGPNLRLAERFPLAPQWAADPVAACVGIASLRNLEIGDVIVVTMLTEPDRYFVLADSGGGSAGTFVEVPKSEVEHLVELPTNGAGE